MNTGLRGAVAILAVASPCLAAADAAPSSLDPVVVTGSRVDHGSFDLPGAVDVVDAGRIGADNARVNVSEALVAVPESPSRIVRTTRRTCRFPRAALAPAPPSGCAAFA